MLQIMFANLHKSKNGINTKTKTNTYVDGHAMNGALGNDQTNLEASEAFIPNGAGQFTSNNNFSAIGGIFQNAKFFKIALQGENSARIIGRPKKLL